MKPWILGAFAALMLSGLVTLTVVEYRAVRDRQSVSDVAAEIRTALPEGSTSDAITRYLDERNVPYSSSSVSQQRSLNTTFSALGVEAGANVIVGDEYQEGTLLWLGPRHLNIVFVLDDEMTLVRLGIVPYNVE